MEYTACQNAVIYLALKAYRDRLLAITSNYCLDEETRTTAFYLMCEAQNMLDAFAPLHVAYGEHFLESLSF